MLPFCALLIFFAASVQAAGPYKPTWDSIDTHPLPQWYDDVKIGIFCHWGAYSVIADGEWFWWYWKGEKDAEKIAYAEKNFPGKSYADLASGFTARHFDAENFAKIVQSAGAKYFVFTSKHHEGFTMFPSNTSFSWNSVDLGPRRDVVGELKKAFDKTDVHFGLYFSQFEWFHPLYKLDNITGRDDYVQQVSLPQMYEIVNNYQPEVIWSDGDWERPSSYWKSTEFLAWLYNESPVKDTVIVNDRWGKESPGKHGGGFFDFSDRFLPSKLIAHKWESCITLDKSTWGYREDSTVNDYLSDAEVIRAVAATIAMNGNILINVGPNKDGVILPIFQDRLQNLGNFVRVHEEAIYKSKPWVYQFEDDKNVWYTSKLRNASNFYPGRAFNTQDEENTVIYAWVLIFPANNKVSLARVQRTTKTKATLLGTDISVPVNENNGGVTIDLYGVPVAKYPSKVAFIIKIEYVASKNVNPLQKLYIDDKSKHIGGNRSMRKKMSTSKNAVF